MAKLTPDGPSIYPNCGTPSGYYRHLSQGIKKQKTQPCRKCKDAVAAKMDRYRHDNGITQSRVVPDSVLREHGIKVGA